MYAWIWRHLPFGLPGKIVGSMLLVGVALAGLWFWGFPWAEQWLPWEDSQIEGSWTPGADVIDPDTPADPELIGPDDQPIDKNDILYDTEQNNPAPDAGE